MGFWKERNRLSRALERAGIRYALRAEGDRIIVDLHPHHGNLARARVALAEWPALVEWLAASAPAGHVELARVTMTAALGPTTDEAREEEAALLAAIVEAPDDDAPRLVYADVLTARGDPYGELIVLQCARADLPVKVHNQLARRRAGFAAELEPFTVKRSSARRSEFVRGFLERVFMTVDEFASHGAHAFITLPTHTVEITDYVPDCTALAATRALAWVRGLVLEVTWPVTLAPLAHGAFDRLASLELVLLNANGDDRSRDDFAFAANVRAPRLSSIAVSNRRTSAFAAGIAANPNLPSLRRYREQGGSWRADEPIAERAAAYARLALRHRLEALALDHEDSSLGDEALLPFFAPDTPAELRVLELRGTGLTDRGVREIARSPKVRRLEQLTICEDAVTAGPLRELIRAAPGLHRISARSRDPDVVKLGASALP